MKSRLELHDGSHPRAGAGHERNDQLGNPVFYTRPELIDEESGALKIVGADAGHIGRSLRCRVGDVVRVGDGSGRLFITRLTAVGEEEVSGTVVSGLHFDKEVPEITLVQAAGRPSSMDESVRRSAECGIARLVPVITPRSPSGYGDKLGDRLSRWRSIARESSKAARRAWPMQIPEPALWPELPEIDSNVGIVLWEGEGRTGLREALPVDRPDSIVLVAGPEGGFSSGEVESLVSLGYVSTGLGRLILRSETAGPYAAMMARFFYGLLGPGDVF